MRPLGRALLLTAIVAAPLGAAIVWAAYGPWGLVPAIDEAGGSGEREIAVRVHAWGFSPRVIHVAPGQTVRFVASSEDIRHGFAINELGVNLALLPGQPVRSPAVTVALPEGIYEIHCSVFCGLGHPSMKARLVVGAPPRARSSTTPWIASLLALAAAALAVTVAARERRG